MTDRDALVRAVLAAPDDDTPRLVFADWLDEHDDPHRAELIRVGCELDRLDREAPWVAAAASWLAHNSTLDREAAEPGVWADHLPDVARRMRLLSRHTWLGLRCIKAERGRAPKVRGERRPWAGHFTRGFLEEVHVKCGEALVANAEVLWGFSPVRRVRFASLSVDGAETVVRAGLLARLDALVVRSPETAQVFGASPDAAAVRSVSVSTDADRTSECLTELATAPHWKGLRDLDVFGGHALGDGGARLTVADVEPLVASRHFRRLTNLKMSFCDFDPGAGRRLCGAAWPALEALELGYTDLDDNAAEALAANPTLGRLRVLELSSNRITARGADALIRSPHLANLTFLDLSYNSLGRGSTRKWTGPCRPPTLRALTLGMSSPSPAAVRAWAACPALTGLVALSAGGHNSGAAEFAAAVGWDRLTVLDFGYAGIDAAAAARVAAWPALRTVRVLNVADNPIEAAGAKALVGSPHLTKLRRLKAKPSEVESVGQTALEERFGKKWRWW